MAATHPELMSLSVADSADSAATSLRGGRVGRPWIPRKLETSQQVNRQHEAPRLRFNAPLFAPKKDGGGAFLLRHKVYRTGSTRRNL
jgi:hypothetical protein